MSSQMERLELELVDFLIGFVVSITLVICMIATLFADWLKAQPWYFYSFSIAVLLLGFVIAGLVLQ